MSILKALKVQPHEIPGVDYAAEQLVGVAQGASLGQPRIVGLIIDWDRLRSENIELNHKLFHLSHSYAEAKTDNDRLRAELKELRFRLKGLEK